MTSLPSARRRRLRAVIGGVIMLVWLGFAAVSLCAVLRGLAEALR